MIFLKNSFILIFLFLVNFNITAKVMIINDENNLINKIDNNISVIIIKKMKLLNLKFLSKAKNLQYLSFENSEIRNLKGIEKLKNLNYLDLRKKNKIIDYQNISNLNKLEIIFLECLNKKQENVFLKMDKLSHIVQNCNYKADSTYFSKVDLEIIENKKKVIKMTPLEVIKRRIFIRDDIVKIINNNEIMEILKRLSREKNIYYDVFLYLLEKMKKDKINIIYNNSTLLDLIISKMEKNNEIIKKIRIKGGLKKDEIELIKNCNSIFKHLFSIDIVIP